MKDSDYLMNVALDIKRRFPLNGAEYSTAEIDQINKILDGLGELARLVELKDYLVTLNICKKALPSHTHPVHFEKLREIEDILRKSYNTK